LPITSSSSALKGARSASIRAAMSGSGVITSEKIGISLWRKPIILPSRTSRSTRLTNLPWLPLTRSGWSRRPAPARAWRHGCGPVRITSIPLTRLAILRSTSKPLCDRHDHQIGALGAHLVHHFLHPLSRMPKLYSGNIQPGWRWACRGRPGRSRRSWRRRVRTILGLERRLVPFGVEDVRAKEGEGQGVSTISLTRSVPSVHSQWLVIASTPSAFITLTMSCPLVRSWSSTRARCRRRPAGSPRAARRGSP
jgi:hypothetical protein